MSEKLIEREIIAYGPTSLIDTYFANLPIKPRSVKVFVDTGAAVLSSGFDDGAGTITGTDFTGVISYSTGRIQLNLLNAIPNNTRYCFISYTYFAVGVSELNKVQYSNQDFETNVAQLTEFLQKEFHEEFNDYVNSDMAMALVDINAYMGQNLSWYLNRKVTDLYFPTAKTSNAVSKISRMLGYKPKGAYSAQVTLSVGLKKGPYSFPVTINKPFAFKGPNGLQFEYRNSVPIVYAPGELIKTFDVNEGETTTESFIADGTTNQIFKLLKVTNGKYIEEGSVVVKVNGVIWTESSIIPFSNTKAFETNILSTPPYIKFGDGIQGQIPSSGLGVEVTYVICNGFSGRIVSGTIKAPVAPLNVSFTEIPFNISQSSASIGGDNPEDLRSITVNAPLFQKSQDRALTKSDYDYLANNYPNVAKADAQIIRTITNDYNIQQYITKMNTYIDNLKSADRYLHPQPQISKLIFSENLFDQNTVQFLFDAITITQTFTTSNDVTLNALMTQLSTLSKILSAIIRTTEEGNVILLTGNADAQFALSSFVVTGGTVANVSIIQASPPPNQIQQIIFDRDLFYGNIINITYASVPITIPFDTDSNTTLNKLVASLQSFAKAPVGAYTEVGTAPNQAFEIKFDKNFFNGCLIQFMLKDLSQSVPVDTLIEVSFNTDNATTYNSCKSALEKLSFVSSATVDAVNRKITVYINSDKSQDISQEPIGYGDGTTATFSGMHLLNYPVKPRSLKVKCGAVTGVDNGSGVITMSLGGGSGTINYSTGLITLNFGSSIPILGASISADYLYTSSSKTASISSINVTINTVSLDEATRTITINTDSGNSLLVTNGSVAAKNPPILSESLVQPMISTSLGSVSTIAGGIESSLSSITAYLDDSMSDGCKANTVQVSVLSQDAARKYASPVPSLLSALNTYLTLRKDIVHKVVTVDGINKVIDVNINIEILVNQNAVQDEIVKKTERALTQADTLPYGLLIEREFNESLYISDIADAIRGYVQDSERDYLNIIITGPAKHSTGLIADEQISVGAGGAFQLINATLLNTPIVISEVKIYVAGILAAEDNGEGVLIPSPGSAYAVTGMIDYVTGVISDMILTPAPLALPVPDLITVTYYQSKLDKRGNYICPTGYVLQYGTVSVKALPRL